MVLPELTLKYPIKEKKLEAYPNFYLVSQSRKGQQVQSKVNMKMNFIAVTDVKMGMVVLPCVG